MPPSGTRALASAAVSGLLWLAAYALPSTQTDAAPAPWEHQVDEGVYENRGVARLDRIGRRWALTVMCDGQHATYLDEAPDLDLAALAGQFVSVRYHWVERDVPDAQCVMAPCEVTERLMAVDEISPVDASAAAAAASVRACRPATD